LEELTKAWHIGAVSLVLADLRDNLLGELLASSLRGIDYLPSNSMHKNGENPIK
jgi:hypothetical protein